MGSEKHPCCVVFGSIEAMKLKCENVPRGTTCTKCQSGRDFTCSKLQLSCGLIETTGQWINVTTPHKSLYEPSQLCVGLELVM